MEILSLWTMLSTVGFLSYMEAPVWEPLYTSIRLGPGHTPLIAKDAIDAHHRVFGRGSLIIALAKLWDFIKWELHIVWALLVLLCFVPHRVLYLGISGLSLVVNYFGITKFKNCNHIKGRCHVTRSSARLIIITSTTRLSCVRPSFKSWTAPLQRPAHDIL